MVQGAEKLQNFLACSCASKIYQVILISSEMNRLLYLLLEYKTQSKKRVFSNGFLTD